MTEKPELHMEIAGLETHLRLVRTSVKHIRTTTGVLWQSRLRERFARLPRAARERARERLGATAKYLGLE